MKKNKPRKNLKQKHRNSVRSTTSLKDFAKILGWKKTKDRWVKA